jgi:hypothetical protein
VCGQLEWDLEPTQPAAKSARTAKNGGKTTAVVGESSKLVTKLRSEMTVFQNLEEEQDAQGFYWG